MLVISGAKVKLGSFFFNASRRNILALLLGRIMVVSEMFSVSSESNLSTKFSKKVLFFIEYKYKKNAPINRGVLRIYFRSDYLTTFTSTLLFKAFPTLVLFEAIGIESPKPAEVNLSEAIPFEIKKSATALALFSDKV